MDSWGKKGMVVELAMGASLPPHPHKFQIH